MPWPAAASASRSMVATPAPTGDALRLATLQASWARDRQVARRRLAWRWLVWAWWRYLLPAAVVLGLSAWLAGWILPRAHQQLSRLPAVSSPPRATSPPPLPAPPAPAAPDSTLTAEGEPLELDGPDAGPLTLRLDSRWATPQPVAADNALSQAEDTLPAPTLTPENWLHSKEP